MTEPTNHNYALILAGGGGTRLWPLSRRDNPKQIIDLIDSQTLFQTSVRRLASLYPPEAIFVVTGASYEQALREQVPELPAANFIIEPAARDNSAAVALALTVIRHRDPNAVVAMLTSDHHIARRDRFLRVLQAGHQSAADGSIVLLGITPTYPATGFGYIQQGEALDAIDGLDIYRVRRFTEKPDIVRANQFVASGLYTWNSGMFVWHVDTAMSEFARQQPDMHALMQQYADSLDLPDAPALLDDIWPQMPRKSIDYAIMEGAQNLVVFPVDIGWNDVGSWASLYDVMPLDRFGNCTKGDNASNRVMFDTHNTLVYSDKLTVAIGIDNVVVVETDDVLMICHRERTQDVKKVVDYLKENQFDDYL